VGSLRSLHRSLKRIDLNQEDRHRVTLLACEHGFSLRSVENGEDLPVNPFLRFLFYHRQKKINVKIYASLLGRYYIVYCRYGKRQCRDEGFWVGYESLNFILGEALEWYLYYTEDDVRYSFQSEL